jgi:toxin CcdB
MAEVLMGQFDIYRNPRKGVFPLLLEIQSEVLSELSTRVVVPMTSIKEYGATPITRLNPTARVGRIEYVLVFQELAAVPRSALGEKVGSLDHLRTELIRAIDLLCTGI